MSSEIYCPIIRESSALQEEYKGIEKPHFSLLNNFIIVVWQI